MDGCLGCAHGLHCLPLLLLTVATADGEPRGYALFARTEKWEPTGPAASVRVKEVGALDASVEAGPAAIFSWAIGGVLILLIALTYAEIGTMFPLSGGVVRFPHMAFGHLASFTSGWITYVAVATTAPIEVEAALQYGTKYADFTAAHEVGGETVYTLTTLGYISAVVLMASKPM